ncbi:RHS repeat protein [Massilia sp. H-1]|nr:RHS repeat protein [Massilia sp. H-1]
MPTVFFSHVYGTMQRLESSTVTGRNGDAAITRLSYDGIGQLTGIVAPDGSAAILGYDDAHRLRSLSDGVGNQVRLDLDGMGNITREELRNHSGELIQARTSVFDALSRLESIQSDPQASATTYQYDRGGNLRTVTDALGRVTTAEFDNLERVAKVNLPPAMPGKSAPSVSKWLRSSRPDNQRYRPAQTDDPLYAGRIRASNGDEQPGYR